MITASAGLARGSGHMWPDAHIIMIVEDEPANARLLCRVLEIGGFQVVVAHSAEEAMAVLEIYPIAAVLTDVRLPGMDGLSLTELVKQRYFTPPVMIVVTGLHQQCDRELAEFAGCDGYITKPFNTRTIANEVRQLVGDVRAGSNVVSI